MKYYAKDDQISTSPLAGGVEISEAEYKTLLSAKLEGRKTDVRNGQPWIASTTTQTIYSTTDGEALEIPDNDDIHEGYTGTPRPSEFAEWVNGAWVEDTAKAQKALLDGYERGLDSHMQEVVRGLTDAQGIPYRFENIISAITYRDKAGDKRQSIAQDLYAWRSDFWDAVDVIYADVMAGNRTQPTLAQLIAELPSFTAGYAGA